MSNTRQLFESYKITLSESNREDALSDIAFIKHLLNKEMNEENYSDKTNEQLYMILNKYKEEYNNSKGKFVARIVTYNITNSSGESGLLSNSGTLVYNFKEAKIFDTREDAQLAIDNYEIPEGCTLIDSKIDKLKL